MVPTVQSVLPRIVLRGFGSTLISIKYQAFLTIVMASTKYAAHQWQQRWRHANRGREQELSVRKSPYLLALGTALVVVVAVIWAVGSEAMPHRGNIAEIDGLRFNTLIPSAQGALAQCVVCHRISAGGPEHSAPSLYGIVDAPKARSRWFAYSHALATQTGTWSAEEIDAYLADPVAYLPGTSKTLSRVRDADERRLIIADLQKLSP